MASTTTAAGELSPIPLPDVQRRQRGVFARQRRAVQIRYLLLILPLIAFLAVFYAYPVASMLLRSVREPIWTLSHFHKLFDTSVYVRVLWITVRIALVVTVVTLILGYLLAYFLASLSQSRANLLMIFVLVPFWTSILVRTYAWMVLLGREGTINRLLQSLGMTDGPVKLLNTTFAVYVGMVHILLPFMVLPLSSVMRGIDRDYLRAAEGLGAPPGQVFRRIFLPLSLPGVAAGCLLVFILSLGFYITPSLIGGPRDVMISVLIQQQVTLNNWPFASTLACVLLAAALVVFVAFTKILGVQRLYGGSRT